MYTVNTSTSKVKFNASMQKLKQWLKENRNLIGLLNKKLKGYYNYYGVIGNSKMLKKMDRIIKKLLFKWMNRRSQRRSFNWEQFNHKINNHYPIQNIFIESSWKQMKLTI